MVMKKEEGFKYFFLVLFIVAAYLSFLVIKPILTAILSGIILGYVFFPLHRWITKFVKQRHVSAVIISLILVSAIFLPIFFFADSLFTEARVGYVVVKQRLSTGNIFGLACPESETSFACVVARPVQNLIADPEINVYLQQAVSTGITFVLNSIQNFLLSLPKLLLNLLVTFFVTFYIFIDGQKLIDKARKILPLRKRHQEHIMKRVRDISFAVIYGNIIVALIQGALGGLGFFLFDVGQPFLWGFVMAVFALVPFIGTAIIWLPAAIFLIVVGGSEGNADMVGNGIGLLLWGSLLVGTVDNIIKPKIVGSRAGIHPVIILVGAIGGLAFMGPVGFIIGPLILALLMTLLDIYEREELIK
jgi:predicted PurR-regulated permease PerM